MERLFEAIRRGMPEDATCRVVECRFASRGILRRLWNTAAAPFHQSRVNHVTGDVHYLTLLLRKSRTVLTVHDCGNLTRLHGWRRWLYNLLWFRLPIRRSQVVTAISEATRQDLIALCGCPPEKVRVIPDCVPSEFKPDPRPFDAERPRILQVGSRKNKNLPRVAEALAGISCTLDIVGRLDDDQRQMLAGHGIDYTDAHDISDEELLQRYRDCDMLVFASTSEGFGMPIIEAQAVGRPVVTSNLQPMPDVGGDGACYVDPLDVAAIRAGLRKVIADADYRAKLVEAGFENAQRFCPEAIAAQYAEVYREVVRAAKGLNPCEEAERDS